MDTGWSCNRDDQSYQCSGFCLGAQNLCTWIMIGPAKNEFAETPPLTYNGIFEFSPNYRLAMCGLKTRECTGQDNIRGRTTNLRLHMPVPMSYLLWAHSLEISWIHPLARDF
jgi:hypothetical protein